MTNKKVPFSAYLSAPLSILTGFILAILTFTFILKETSPVPIFVIFAVLEIGGILLYGVVPDKWKNRVRMGVMFLFTIFLLILAGILGKWNFQIEAFWFYLFSGTMAGVLVHFFMAKIIGPLFFGRNWCAWGCWSSAIFDLLPYKTDIKWQKGHLDKLRLVHFALSLGIVLALLYGLNYAFVQTDPEQLANGSGTTVEWLWLIAGNLLYYITGIALAIKLKDNRAFCKYLCPITVFLKATNTISFLRIKATDGCNNCKTCNKVCPMGVDVQGYVTAKTRVCSSECILCLKCVSSCPQAVLRTSLGVDFAGTEKLIN